MNYPITIDYMPDVMNIKKIKDRIYEAYVPISEEAVLKDRFIPDMIQHKINEFRSMNFFVKKVYTKFFVVSNGCMILAFELVRLRDPVIHRLGK